MPEAATLFKEWSGYLKPEDLSQVESAYHFSEAAHEGQFRQSGEPYISHPLAVANILAQWHLAGADRGAAARCNGRHRGYQD
jgi:GTP pyrophosphokinase